MALAVWFVGDVFGVVVSVLSVAAWVAGDVSAGAKYSGPFVPVWNALIAVAFLVIVVGILTRLRKLHRELEARVLLRTLALTNEMQERMRLEKELLGISEREQRRIGHDLHDSLCQHLTGTALAGHVLGEKLAEKSLPEAAAANHLVKLVEEAIDLTRTLARGLHPAELEGEGFMDGFRELAATITERFKVPCGFECSEAAELHAPAGAIHLYRIAQEAVTNAVKHGKARQITIRLKKDGDAISLAVDDDGIGLPENARTRQGMGLRIMAYRASMIGSATFSICAAHARGTRRSPALCPSRGAWHWRNMGHKTKILLVDDHPLVREWLANLINQQLDCQVCGEAANESDALELIGTAKPAIAIVDVSLEGGSGIELIKNIKALYPDVMVIVLSMHDEMLYAERALRAGARGYIMKREATKKVLQAIRCVLEGRLYISEKVTAMMAEKFVDGQPAATDSPVQQLSDRELEVFQLLGRGYSTRQIAEDLHISFKTVQAYYARIKEKLNLTNATELLREAIRWHDGQQNK